MTESTSHVEQQVQARIAAAKVRVQAAKERRDDLAAARKRGLAHRHARKLRNLAEAEQRTQQPAFCDGCNGTAETYEQISHDPWCTTADGPGAAS